MMFAKKNYTSSTPSSRSFRWPGTVLLMCALAAGCGAATRAPRDAHHVAFADLTGPNRALAAGMLTTLPVIIHFRQGERVPLDLQLQSALADLETGPQTLVVKRDFYMLLQPGSGPRLSEDGVDFSAPRKNHFFFGFSVTKDAPTTMKAVFGIRPEPAADADG